MYLFIEISGLAAVKTFLVSIPESIELLAFGVGLVAAVVLLRWFLNRGNSEKTDENFSEKGVMNN